jgi:hypothetical protein
MRLRFRANQSHSRLESRFLFLWQLAKGPPLEAWIFLERAVGFDLMLCDHV